MKADSMLGAAASSAGDDFHELWALRKVLSLLDPASRIAEIKVEGVPDDEIHADLGQKAQAVDVAVRRRGDVGDEFVYEQLKFSPSHPDKAWTWARLTAKTAKTKPHSSVLGKLAQLFLAVDTRATFAIVTNQPLADDVINFLPRLLDTSKPLDVPDRALREKLKTATGCDDVQLAMFLKAWDLSGFGSVSRLRIETDIMSRIAEMTDADARNDAGLLRQRMAMLVLPENRAEPSVTRGTLLVWLGAGSTSLLFPAPSRIAKPKPYLPRTVTDDLVALIKTARKPVRLDADGGCGKTSLVSTLGPELPAGSELIAFDCYGGGLFLSSDDRRHAPETAFTQVANEVAARLASPFVMRRSGSGPVAGAFKRRIDAAAAMLGETAPDALLVLCFDAADNARIAAEVWKEPCFLDELLAMSLWPDNVRVLITCRSARKDLIGRAELFEPFHLDAFDLREVEGLVALAQPGWGEQIARTLHDLTGGTPRRIAYALEGLGPGDEAVAVERLMPRATGIDPLFERLVADAGVRIGGGDKVWRVLWGLANLPRPTPAWALAGVAGLLPADISDIAGDVGGLVEHAGGWSFGDEDFEFFVDERTKATTGELLPIAADLLFARRSNDPYAAAAVAEMLLRADRLHDLYELALATTEGSTILDKLQARTVQAKRLTLALRCCRQASDVATACDLLVAAAEGIKSHRIVNDLISKNLDLAARFSPDEAMRLVLVERRLTKQRAALRVHLAAAAAQARPATARAHLRWWEEELRDRNATPKEERFLISSGEIAAEHEAVSVLYGDASALRDALRWRPLDLLFSVLRRRIADAAGSKGDMIVKLIEARRWPPAVLAPLLAASLMAGIDADHPVFREGLQRLASSRATRWSDVAAHEIGLSPLLSLRDSTLLVCEIASRDAEIAPLVLNILEKAFPSQSYDDYFAINRHAAAGHLNMRVLALRDLLNETTTTADQHLPAKRQPLPPRKLTRRQEVEAMLSERKKTDDDHWNDAIDEAKQRLAPLLEASRARLRALHVLGIPDPESIVKALARPYSLGRSPSGSRSVQGFVRDWLVGIAVTGGPVDEQLQAGVGIMRDWAAAGSDARLDLAASLAHVPGAHSAALKLLTDLAVDAETMAAPASDRAASLMKCARVAWPMDAELAEDFYDRAIAVTEKVDIEVVAQLALCAAIADAGVAGTRDERRHLAERLTNVAASVEATIGLTDNFPWSDVVQAAAGVDLPTALAAVGQWRDAGVLPLVRGISAVLDGKAAGMLTGAQRFALSELRGEEILDPVDAFGGVRDVPPAAMDYHVRRLLCSADATRILDEKWALPAIEGRFVSAGHAKLHRTADIIRSWRTRGDEPDGGGDPDSTAAPLETIGDVQSALTAAAERKHGLSSDDLVRLAGRVHKPQLRTNFLDLAHDIVGSDGALGHALISFLPGWRDYPPVVNWARSTLPGYIANAIKGLFEWRYEDTDILDALLETTGLDPAAQIDALLEAVLRNGSELSAELIFSIVGAIAARSDAVMRERLLRELLDRAERRTDRSPALLVDSRDVPDDIDECVARLLFAVMADMDKRIRWQASHAALQLFRLGDPSASKLTGLLDAPGEPAFAAPGLPFYLYAAREQLMTTIARATIDAPELVARNAASVLRAIEADPHLTVRELGRLTLIRLLDEGHISDEPGSRSKLQAFNRSPFAPAPSNAPRGHFWNKNTDSKEPKRKFRFDETDTIPYWYRTPTDLFGMTTADFLDHVERWVNGAWGFVDTDAHWAEEPRLDRLREEHGETSHRHGTQPVIERLSRYAEWHGMLCAVGELITTRPLSERERYGVDWEEWLDRQLPTAPPCWLSDLRTPPPLEPRFWGYPPACFPLWGDRDALDALWTARVPVEVFDQEIGLKEGHPSEIAVAADYQTRFESRPQDVTIWSALVTPETAHALAHALLTAKDPMDFIIPPANDDRGSDVPGFQLQGWLADLASDPRTDRHDESRGAVWGVPIEPSHPALDAFNLRFDRSSFSWVQPESDAASLQLAFWGAREPPPPGSGWRAVAPTLFLVDLLDRAEMSMIFSVEIKRRLAGESSRARTQWQLYVLDRRGELRRVDRRPRSVGRFLVRREGLDRSVDTAGRWMLHRLEELMSGLGNLSGRRLAERQDTIQSLYTAFVRHRAAER